MRLRIQYAMSSSKTNSRCLGYFPVGGLRTGLIHWLTWFGARFFEVFCGYGGWIGESSTPSSLYLPHQLHRSWSSTKMRKRMRGHVLSLCSGMRTPCHDQGSSLFWCISELQLSIGLDVCMQGLRGESNDAFTQTRATNKSLPATKSDRCKSARRAMRLRSRKWK